MDGGFEVVIGESTAGAVSKFTAVSDRTEVIELPAIIHWGGTCGAAPITPGVRHYVIESATR